MMLRQYISYLMEKRFPLSWSFEGTRSRVGKLMPPRYGLLKYVMDSAHATGARNLHIIPISISYDMIGDVKDYAKEQSGGVKRPESLSWFVGYLRRPAPAHGQDLLRLRRAGGPRRGAVTGRSARIAARGLRRRRRGEPRDADHPAIADLHGAARPPPRGPHRR
jgi:hypothetical protein